jgi:hypothetical protein
MKFLLYLFFVFSLFPLSGQSSFPEKWLGAWSGIMQIYSKGALTDSLPIKLYISKTNAADTFIWKTEYLSEKFPMVKDYKLVLFDVAKGVYLTSEGDGINLWDYLFDQKFYSVFETQGILLTSTYELKGNQILFEVTSGKELVTENGVKSYSVLNLQRALLTKIE